MEYRVPDNRDGKEIMDNNQQNREMEKIILSVQRATLLMDPFFKITMVGTMLLITNLARLAKEGKLSKGEFKNIQEFIKATDGNFTIVNIPFEKNQKPWKAERRRRIVDGHGEEYFIVKNSATNKLVLGKDGKEQHFSSTNQAEKMAEQLNRKEDLVLESLKQKGIRHIIMPDLDMDDGMVQVAVYNGDRQKFANWNERYLRSKMRGGEHSVQELRNLTEGRTSIISLPIEGQVEEMETDFQTFEINYAVLPDLCIGDGDIHLVVANADLQKVQHWFNIYKEQKLEQGETVKDMQTVSMEQYMRTGEMSEEAYIDTADPDFRNAMEKYDGREPGAIEQAVKSNEGKARTESNPEYEAFHSNPNFIELSIDKETLIDKMHLPAGQVKEFADGGHFASRVPGTWKRGSENCEPEKILLVPEEQVFTADEGKRYVAFLDRNTPCGLYGLNEGKVVETLSVEELRSKYYDKPTREFWSSKKLSKSAARTAEKPMDKKNPLETKTKKGGVNKDFNNFKHRKYDYDNLEAALLGQEAKKEKMPKPPVKAR